MRYYKYEYNADGRYTKKEYYGGEGNLERSYQYEYTPHGRYTIKEYYNVDDANRTIREYYNSADDLIKQEVYDADGKLWRLLQE